MSMIEIDLQRRSRVTVMQGSAHVSAEPGVVLSTVLGSCIAACLYDPRARIGGMNHFLLPEPNGAKDERDEAYGVYLMEVLINAMLVNGAQRANLRAHLYGGASFNAGMAHVGRSNAAFARAFLKREGIICANADLGGTSARRVEFAAAAGRARSITVDPRTVPAERPPPHAGNDVELF